VAGLNRTLSILTLGVAGDALARASGPRGSAPGLGDLQSLLAAPPTGTAISDETAARKRTKAAARGPVARPTILTGALGDLTAAPAQRKTLLGS
jgi:hypothetical protein